MPKYYDVMYRYKCLNIFRSGNFALPFLTAFTYVGWWNHSRCVI